MFRRFLRRGPGLGDTVTVLAGAYANHSGQVAEVGSDGRLRVVIDDCCQPIVEPADVMVTKTASRREQTDTARHLLDGNLDTQYVAAMAENNSPLSKPF